MKNYKYLLIAIFLPFLSMGQSGSEAKVDPYFVKVDEKPKFPGGTNEMYNFIGANISYPEDALKKDISGKVYLSFIVEKDGSLSTFVTLKGIGYGCDEEAKRVLKAMPNWTPGKKEGKIVRTKFTMPIMFALD